MISNAKIKDFDSKHDAHDLLPHDVSALSFLRGKHLIGRDEEDDDDFDDMMTSMDTLKLMKNKTFRYSTKPRYIGNLEDGNYVNSKRKARANFLRDEYRYSIKFLET